MGIRIIAGGLVAALMAAGSAQAAEFTSVGCATTSGPSGVSCSGGSSFSFTATLKKNTSVTDTFSFDLTKGGYLSFDGFSTNSGIGTLYYDSTPILALSNIAAASTPFAVVPGLYSFVVKGSDGSTSSKLKIDGIVSSVPEPATYLLLLAGLGVVWFASRRQRSIRVGLAA